MKIGINASFLRKKETGMGQYSLYLLRAILTDQNNLKHKFYLYFEEESGYDLIENTDNLVKKILKVPFYKRDDLVKKATWEQLVLPREVKKQGIDVFFTPFNSITKLKNIRHVMTLHDVIWKIYKKQYVNNTRKKIYFEKSFSAVEAADEVITVSVFSKREILKYLDISPERITVIKNGVADYFRYEQNKSKIPKNVKKFGVKDPYIFYIGGFEKRKNLDLLIKAFAILAKNYQHALENRKLVIAGELWEKENPLVLNVKKLVKELGIEDKVIFLGKVEDQDRAALYSRAELFVFPSLYEGFGMTILEAMAAGCPVLASNISPFKELARDAIDYFNPYRQDELLQEMIRLLTDKELRIELSLRGIERSRSFSWDKAAQETMRVLTQED
ncbi:MAG: glycosyltransferase [Candidatus Moranbacteria bacterium]|nr:glycosyltransferase [Candidatus Moranbacteria bacterium]